MYILNPRLAADIFDGEYVIANLDTGLYYSVQGAAVNLLQALPCENIEASVKSIAEANLSYTNVETELLSIWKELLTEEIVREVPGDKTKANDNWEPTIAYTTPKFNRYADMQDLLMLDPIHDVDEEGWPVKPD